MEVNEFENRQKNNIIIQAGHKIGWISMTLILLAINIVVLLANAFTLNDEPNALSEGVSSLLLSFLPCLA